MTVRSQAFPPNHFHSLYSSSSDEEEFKHSLVDSKGKNTYKKQDNDSFPLEILNEVFGGDLEHRVESVEETSNEDWKDVNEMIFCEGEPQY